MPDNNRKGYDDHTGKPIATGIRPKSEWRPMAGAVEEFVPPAKRGVGMYQGGNGKSKPAPEADKPLDVETLHDFTDHIDALAKELTSRDRNSWTLGKIAAHFDITVGRPTADDKANEVPTLNDLAREAECSPQRLSEWRNCYVFWDDKTRASVGLDVRWEFWNLARRHVAGDEALRELATALLRTAVHRHYSAELFGDYLGNLRFYTAAIRTAYLPPLDEQHLTIARKASAGKLANAEELLDKAKSMGLDVAAFRKYCDGYNPTPGGAVSGYATEFTVPESTVLEDDYYGWLREALPQGVKAGEKYEITIRKLD